MTAYKLWSLADMLELPIGRFSVLVHEIASLEQFVRLSYDDAKTGSTSTRAVEEADVLKAVSSLEEFADMCSILSMEITAIASREAAKQLRQLPNAKSGARDVRLLSGIELTRSNDALLHLTRTIKAESSIKTALILPASAVALYEPAKPLFGQEVSDKFPRLIDEIRESGKCLGLQRSTASVFHSLRCLEAGIEAISKCLGIPDPTKGSERNWQFALGKIDEKVTEKWPKNVDRFAGDGKVFEEILGALKGMRNPYRNACMHLDGVYTQEQAEHIMAMVKGIMQNISSRMDENGLPHA